MDTISKENLLDSSSQKKVRVTNFSPNEKKHLNRAKILSLRQKSKKRTSRSPSENSKAVVESKIKDLISDSKLGHSFCSAANKYSFEPVFVLKNYETAKREQKLGSELYTTFESNYIYSKNYWN